MISQRIVVPMILWFLSFIILRNYIGGYHASTHIRCILFSTVFGMISLTLFKTIPVIKIREILFFYLSCFLLLCFFPPIVNETAPIADKNNDRMQLKRKGWIALFAESLSSILLFFFLPTLSNSIVIGTLGAELLYIMAWIKKAISSK